MASGQKRNFHILILAWALGLSLSACKYKVGPRSRDKDVGSDTTNVETTEANGVLTATISASSTKTQVLSGSGALAGASVEFPPGSLAVDTTLTVEEGED